MDATRSAYVRAAHSQSRNGAPGWRKSPRARDGIRRMSLKQSSDSKARPDLNTSDVYRRLSDIIDSDLASPTTAGDFMLSEVLVEHALGAALVADFNAPEDTKFEAAEKLLADWSDPIFGLDELAGTNRVSPWFDLRNERNFN